MQISNFGMIYINRCALACSLWSSLLLSDEPVGKLAAKVYTPPRQDSAAHTNRCLCALEFNFRVMRKRIIQSPKLDSLLSEATKFLSASKKY